MTWPFLLVLVYLTAVMQLALGPVLSIGPIAPDLFALLATVWVIVVPRPATWLVGLVAGTAADLTTGSPLGTGALVYVAAAAALRWVVLQMCLDSPWTRALAIGVVTTGLTGTLAAIEQVTRSTDLSAAVLAGRAAATAAYVAGLALPILMIAGWLMESRSVRQPGRVAARPV